jgi:hypothetical protein
VSLGSWDVDDPGRWTVGCWVLLFIYTCRACADWAIGNVIEHQNKVVLAVEIEACVLSGRARRIQTRDCAVWKGHPSSSRVCYLREGTRAAFSRLLEDEPG